MPVINEENIFSALFRWGDARSKEEDFYSKSLVLVLKRIQTYKADLVTKLLNSLFGGSGLQLAAQGLKITDHTGNSERPDITLECDNILAYLEVKVSSPVDLEQLQSYKNELHRKRERRKPFLLLLTRLGCENDSNIPCQQVSWMRVWQGLGDVQRELEVERKGADIGPEAYYLVRAFRLFLKEKGMGSEQVSKILSTKDLHNLRRVLSLVLAGCRLAGLVENKGGRLAFDDQGLSDDSCLGWWLKRPKTGAKPQYWCGFSLNSPTTFSFGFTEDAYKRLSRRVKRLPDVQHRLQKQYNLWVEEGYAECSFALPDDFTSQAAEKQVNFVYESVVNILTIAGEQITAETR